MLDTIFNTSKENLPVVFSVPNVKLEEISRGDGEGPYAAWNLQNLYLYDADENESEAMFQTNTCSIMYVSPLEYDYETHSGIINIGCGSYSFLLYYVII